MDEAERQRFRDTWELLDRGFRRYHPAAKIVEIRIGDYRWHPDEITIGDASTLSERRGGNDADSD